MREVSGSTTHGHDYGLVPHDPSFKGLIFQKYSSAILNVTVILSASISFAAYSELKILTTGFKSEIIVRHGTHLP